MGGIDFSNLGTILMALGGSLGIGVGGYGGYRGIQWWRKPTLSSSRDLAVRLIHETTSHGIDASKQMTLAQLVSEYDERIVWQPDGQPVTKPRQI